MTLEKQWRISRILVFLQPTLDPQVPDPLLHIVGRPRYVNMHPWTASLLLQQHSFMDKQKRVSYF